MQKSLFLTRLVLLLLDAVGGLGRHEGQLGGDARRAGRAAQQAAQVRQRQAHPAHGGGRRGLNGMSDMRLCFGYNDRWEVEKCH